jgi:membrane protease YdiL (CAAX protease family)
MADALSPRSAPALPLNRALSTTTPPTSQTRNKRHALLELALGYGLILLVLWVPRPLERPLYILAAMVIASILWIGFTTAQSMGLRSTNSLRSLCIVAIALLLSAVSVTLAVHFQTLHPVHGPIAFCKRYWGYALWSFVQQLLLQDFFLRRLRLLLPSAGLAALIAAAIFSIAHLPSPVLTVVTFILGLVACLLFLRYRNLYPLAIAHAILGITLPSPLIRNMRVGRGYFTYTPHRHPRRNHSDHVASTSACVIAGAPTLSS